MHFTLAMQVIMRSGLELSDSLFNHERCDKEIHKTENWLVLQVSDSWTLQRES
jgi:hypothetical protein